MADLQRTRSWLSGLLLVAGVATVVSGLLELYKAWLWYSNASQLSNDQRSLFGSADIVDKINSVTDTANPILLGVGLIVLVALPLFLVWQFRLARNAKRLGAKGLGPGWAIGGWFIPVANWILGPLQLQHAAKASGPDRRSARLILLWGFGLFAAPALLVLGGAISSSDNDIVVGLSTLHEVRTYALSAAVVGLSILVLGLVGIGAARMVRRLTDRQAEASTRLGTPASGSYSALV